MGGFAQPLNVSQVSRDSVSPVFSIEVLKLHKLISVKLSNGLKAYQGDGRAPVSLICIFRIKLFGIMTTAYKFFVTVGLFVRP